MVLILGHHKRLERNRKIRKPSLRNANFFVKMNQPYIISNLDNQEREVGSQNAPFLYKITSGQRDGKSIIFHAQIGTEYFMYRISDNVNSQSINLRCKTKGCPAVAKAHIPKSSGLIKVKGTRSDGKGRTKARLENKNSSIENLFPVSKFL